MTSEERKAPMMRTVALCTLTGFLIGLGQGYLHAPPRFDLGGFMLGAALFSGGGVPAAFRYLVVHTLS